MTGQMAFHAARIVLLGDAECGKTTLQRAMRVGTLGISRDYEPTMMMEMQYLPIGDGAKQKMLTIWDLAGGDNYAAGQQQYIVDGSIYLLCVPCLDVKELNDGWAQYVGRFLDALELSAPSAIVLPVLTKSADSALEVGLNQSEVPHMLPVFKLPGVDEKVAFLTAKGVSPSVIASVVKNIQCEAY